MYLLRLYRVNFNLNNSIYKQIRSVPASNPTQRFKNQPKSNLILNADIFKRNCCVQYYLNDWLNFQFEALCTKLVGLAVTNSSPFSNLHAIVVSCANFNNCASIYKQIKIIVRYLYELKVEKLVQLTILNRNFVLRPTFILLVRVFVHRWRATLTKYCFWLINDARCSLNVYFCLTDGVLCTKSLRLYRQMAHAVL